MVDELELIRRKKLEELRKKMEMQKENKQEVSQEELAIAKLEQLVTNYLTPEAKQRLYNIKVAHPDKYLLALQVIYQVIQRYNTKIDDTTLKKLLANVFSETRREPKIKFIR